MIGVVADDITGANDIGIMYGKSGWKTNVYPYSYTGKEESDMPDVFILDTNSRLDSEDEAYSKVFQSTKRLETLGCKQFFNKTCSVFRGNIGAEFDAMLDALGETFAVVVLGFPKNGRTTLNQEHFVHGIKLEESSFRHDPVHPMTKSNLVEILQEQTERKVGFIDIETVRMGNEAIKNEIHNKREAYNYLILDVENQDSLKEIAKAIKDEKVIAGASGIAEELALVNGQPKESKSDIMPDKMENKGVLCVAGSLTPQTKEQIDYMRERNFPVVELETIRLLEDERQGYLRELTAKVENFINEGKDVVFHASNDPDAVAETKELGRQQGYSNEGISRFVSDALAEIVLEVSKRTVLNRFLFAGGETSAAICDSLGIQGLRVYKEIEPGLPSCINLKTPHYLLILKSGSFGSKNFFEKAFSHLKEN